MTGKWRDELAGGEIIQGAEAAGELVGAQAAVAVEPAQKLLGGWQALNDHAGHRP